MGLRGGFRATSCCVLLVIVCALLLQELDSRVVDLRGLACLLGVRACRSSHMQHFSGEIRAAGVPSSDLVVRVVSGEAGACEGGRDLVEVRTDQGGRFVVGRPVSFSVLAVIVDRVTVCVRRPEGWKILWDRTYGPAAATIRLRCDLERRVQGRAGNDYCNEELTGFGRR
jgi:hypothetical protein